MLKKRIIPCLDIRDGRTVKGIHFEGLRDSGDPVELAEQYAIAGADELVLLDITATLEQRAAMLDLVSQVAARIAIPFTVGGGIRSVTDAAAAIAAGADKVSINSAALARPALLTDIANNFGVQCTVLAIDVKFEQNNWMVYGNGGTRATGRKAIEWAREAVDHGAGELLLTSMNNDGTQEGFSIDITAAIASAVNVPVIASGGAGTEAHFARIFRETAASAALAASVFHFGQIRIPQLKQYLYEQQIPVRWQPSI